MFGGFLLVWSPWSSLGPFPSGAFIDKLLDKFVIALSRVYMVYNYVLRVSLVCQEVAFDIRMAFTLVCFVSYCVSE